MAMPFTIEEFREAFPEFSDSVAYPDSVINRAYLLATIQFSSSCGGFSDEAAVVFWEYATAFELTIITNATNGGGGGGIGILSNASQSDVSIGYSVPSNFTVNDAFLLSNPYGQQLYNMLKSMGIRKAASFIGNKWGC